MRAEMVTNLIKEEWREYRRMLFWYFFITVILEIAVIFCGRNSWVMNQIAKSEFSFEEISMIVFSLLVVPYVIAWVMITYKMDQEKKFGHYTFLHTLPVTTKEIVTAKYISVLLINGVLFGWLCGLWLVYEGVFPNADSSRAWTGLCIVAFFFAFSLLAFQMGTFFCWGESYLFLGLLFLIVLNPFDFVGQIAEQTIKWMEQAPLLLWGIASVLTLFIWIICWRWSVKAYRKY